MVGGFHSLDVRVRPYYQFEAIHPFLDGNGRVGRLLIVLFLVDRERLTRPVLYLSPYLERHREAYIGHLQATHERGDPDPWIGFFAGRWLIKPVMRYGAPVG